MYDETRLCLSGISAQDSYIAEKNQANQTKPKTKPTKLSETPWIILFLWVEPSYQISAS